MNPSGPDDAEANELQPVRRAAHAVEQADMRPQLHRGGVLVHRIRVATLPPGRDR